MAYRITGKVIHIGYPLRLTSKAGKEYTKRDLVIAVRKFDQYTGQPTDDPNDTPKFTFMEDKAQALNTLAIGDLVTISFEVSGREYTNRENQQDWFTDIRPTFIGKVNVPTQTAPDRQEAPQMVAQPQVVQPTPAPQSYQQPASAKSDDLPF